MLVSNLWFNYSTNLGVRVEEVKSLCRSSYKELKKNKKGSGREHFLDFEKRFKQWMTEVSITEVDRGWCKGFNKKIK